MFTAHFDWYNGDTMPLSRQRKRSCKNDSFYCFKNSCGGNLGTLPPQLVGPHRSPPLSWRLCTKSQPLKTLLKVSHNQVFLFEPFTAQMTAEVSVIRVTVPMTSQFTCRVETLWTFTANVRLSTFIIK